MSKKSEQHFLEKQFRDHLSKYRKQLILHEREVKGYQSPKGKQFTIEKLTPIEDTILKVDWESHDVPYGYSRPSRKVTFTDDGEMIIIEALDDYQELLDKYIDHDDEVTITLKKQYSAMLKQVERAEKEYKDKVIDGDLSTEVRGKLDHESIVILLDSAKLTKPIEKLQHDIEHLHLLIDKAKSGEPIKSRVKDPDKLISIYEKALKEKQPQLDLLVEKYTKAEEQQKAKQAKKRELTEQAKELEHKVRDLRFELIDLKTTMEEHAEVLIAKEILAKTK